VAWHYAEMSRRGALAGAGKRDGDELTAEYEAMLMKGLKVMGHLQVAGAKHVNVLQHLMELLKCHLSRGDKAYRR